MGLERPLSGCSRRARRGRPTALDEAPGRRVVGRLEHPGAGGESAAAFDRRCDAGFHHGLLVITGMALGIVGCVSASGPRPGPAGSGAVPVFTTPVTTLALSLEGTPYRNGGESPRGFDCSGFTRYVFGRQGLDLPRRAQDQFAAGEPVRSVGEIRPGDLVFFETVSSGASHVGIALGNDRFIHAPSSRGRVRIERLGARYWSRRYVGARRLPPPRRPPSSGLRRGAAR